MEIYICQGLDKNFGKNDPITSKLRIIEFCWFEMSHRTNCMNLNGMYFRQDIGLI